MDLQTRKIEFVQEFLKLQSEEVISQFENLLKKKAKLAADFCKNKIANTNLDFGAKATNGSLVGPMVRVSPLLIRLFIIK